jgi:hypothetical protein
MYSMNVNCKISFQSSPEVVAWGYERRNSTYSHNWKQYLIFNLLSRRALRANHSPTHALVASSLTGLSPLSFSLFYLLPMRLCFNKVAPARDGSSTLCLCLSPDRNACPMGYESRLTRWEELEKFQPCNVLSFPHSAQKKMRASISFSLPPLHLLSSFSIWYSFRLIETTGCYSLWLYYEFKRQHPASKQPWGASCDVWRHK